MKEGQGILKFQYQENKGIQVLEFTLGIESDSSKGESAFSPSCSPVQSEEEVSIKFRGSSCLVGALGAGLPLPSAHLHLHAPTFSRGEVEV